VTHLRPRRCLTLIPRCTSSRSEMASLAVLVALSGGPVAPMFFTPDDNFDDLPETAALPDCAVALLTKAGSWSARNQKNGFVPTAKLAGFCGDPAQAAEALVRCRWWRRAKGGFQFTDWPGWLRLVPDAESAASDEDAAALERRRAADRERQQRRRARDAAEAGEPARTRGRPAKPQVKNMSRDMSRDGITGHVTDLDRSLNQSSVAGRSRPDTRASADTDEAALVAAVADAICARTGQVVGDDTVRAAIAEVRRRARKARTKIHNPLAYIPAAIANEPDLWSGLLLPEPPPLQVILADARDGDRPPGYDPKLVHEFDLSTATGACKECDHPRSSWRHPQARTA
jgi:hypothetical protein